MIGIRRRPRVVAILLTLAVVLTACGGDDETADDTTTTERPATTEPEATTTTTSLDDEPPELENTGEDFEAIMQSINEYENWLSQHPDPELLDQIFDPSCACYQDFEERLATLERNGWRLQGPQSRYESIEVVANDSEDSVGITAVLRPITLTVVDSAGERVETSDELPPPTKFLFTLSRTEDRWRIFDSQALGPAEE